MNGTFMRIWGWPLVIGTIVTSGLFSALLSDGWGDAWSWLALGLPVAVSAWRLAPRRRRRLPSDG